MNMNDQNPLNSSHCKLIQDESIACGPNNSEVFNSLNDEIQIKRHQVHQIPLQNQQIQELQLQKKEKQKKAFSALIVYFHQEKFKRKLLALIHPFKTLTKPQFQIIFDKASSFKNQIINPSQKMSFIKQNSVVTGIETKFKQTINNIQTQIKKKLLKYLELIPIIDPYSSSKLFWDANITILRIYQLIWIPILIAFKNGTLEDFNAYTMNISSISFLIDLALQTFTIKFDKGFPVKDRSQLLKYQVNIWTAIEFFSFIISLIFSIQFHEDNYSMSIVEKDGWTKVFLLLLIVQAKNIVHFIENVQYRMKPSNTINSFIELIKLICLILLIQHLFSCIWVIIGTSEHMKNYRTWFDVTEITVDSPWYQIYLEAIYFISVTTFTVGYGDIAPQNSFEKLFVIIYMFFCTFQLSYSVNTIGSILTQMKENNEEIKKKLTSITEYMRIRQMSNGLQCKIREYLIFYWQQELIEKKNQTIDIIKLLPEQLQQNLQSEISLSLLTKCQYFKNQFSSGFINQLKDCAKIISFPPGTLIENQENIYIIESGIVELIQQQTIVGQLVQYEVFGFKKSSMDVLIETQFRTKTFVNLLVIEYHQLVELVKQNQNELEIVSQTTFNIQSDCLICKGNHFTELCNLVHFIPDKEKVIKKYQYNTLQNRKSNGRLQNRQRKKSIAEQKINQETAELMQQDLNDEIELLYPHMKHQMINQIDLSDQKQKIVLLSEIKQDSNQNLDLTELGLYNSISDKYKLIQLFKGQIQKDIYYLYKKLQSIVQEDQIQIDKYKTYKHFYKHWNIERILCFYNMQNYSTIINEDKTNIKKAIKLQKYLLFPKMFFSQYYSQNQPNNTSLQDQNINKKQGIRSQKRRKRIQLK